MHKHIHTLGTAFVVAVIALILFHAHVHGIDIGTSALHAYLDVVKTSLIGWLAGVGLSAVSLVPRGFDVSETSSKIILTARLPEAEDNIERAMLLIEYGWYMTPEQTGAALDRFGITYSDIAHAERAMGI